MLTGSQNYVSTTVSINDVADLTNLQCIGCNFKRFLHLPSTKWTEIAAAFGRAAIREARSNIFELGLAGDDVIAKGFELGSGGVSGGVTDDATFWIFP